MGFAKRLTSALTCTEPRSGEGTRAWAAPWPKRVRCSAWLGGRPPAGLQGCGVGLRRAYWVAQVCNADARDHGRVAEDDWGAGEVVEESNSGAEKKRCDVDVDFVEESSVEALLDGVGAVDSNGLPGSCGFSLVDGGFDTVGESAQSSRDVATRRGCGG